MLIKTMISDHLAYVQYRQRLVHHRRPEGIRGQAHRAGQDRRQVGRDAAGPRILRRSAPHELREQLRIPSSYFSAPTCSTLHAVNGLMHWTTRNTKARSEIRADYPSIQQDLPGRLVLRRHCGGSCAACWKSWGAAGDRALLQPAGRQLRLFLRRQVREPLLPQPGHAEGKPARAAASHHPHLRQRPQPRCPALPAQQGIAGL